MNGTQSPESEAAVREALRGVDDPEVGIDIVELGLVYGIEVGVDAVRLRLTMTSAACPLGEQIAQDAAEAVAAARPDLPPVEVSFVWEPPWHPGLMSAAARRQLGWPDEGTPGG